MRRYALAAAFGAAALSLSETNIDYLIGTLSPANVSMLFSMDIPSARSRALTLDLDKVDLGDCLRDRSPHPNENWPSTFAVICDDLASATASGIALTREEPKPHPVMPPPPRPDAPSARTVARATVGRVALPQRRPVREIAKAIPGKVEAVHGEIGPPDRFHRPFTPSGVATEQGLDNSVVRLSKTDGAIGSGRTTGTKIARVPAPAAPPACTVDEEGRSILRRVRGLQILPRRIVTPDAVGKSEGIALHVPADCNVRSPVDAKVLFADEFKGYRGVVILELSRGRRLVVAGLGTLAVVRGSRIERGDIIGATSTLRAPALASAFGTAEDSLIFFDVRNDRGGAEPVSWLAAGLSG